MNTASWIALYFAILLPFVLRRRKKRAACGSSASRFCGAVWIVIACAILFYFAFNRSHIAPTALRIPTLPTLPRIVAPHITVPTLRISARPLAIQMSASTAPTTQVSNLWVEDWPQFQKTTHWRGFRAESSDWCVTETEARQQAIENAASTLSLLAIADPSLATDAVTRDSVAQNLKKLILPNLQSGAFIADQYDQTTEKPYGTLYKTYLLIDASPPNASPLNQAAREILAQMKASEVTTWASTAGLFLVIVLLYAFLNAATKGYFVWKLRAAALMVLIAVVLAVFAWGS